jgi:glucose/mannose-6-phosphate isomerase
MIEKEFINLDNPQVYPKIDPDGMLDHIHNIPQMCQQAWQMAMEFKLPRDFANINKIIVLGMGGSAIGGDLVSSLAVSESRAPVMVGREYNLPAHIDDKTLVIASSYSGNTEETLSAFEQSLDTPAKKLAITTGGKLKELCEGEEIPVFSFSYKCQPRAALPFSVFGLLGILQRLDFFKDKYPEVSEAIYKLQDLTLKITETAPTSQNPAKSLAQKMYGRLPVIYGAGITAEVAHRWKTQINENSKTTAFYEVFSELNHNSVVGYSLPEEVTHQLIVVMLNSSHLHERIHLRYDITQTLLDQAGIYYQVLNAEGQSPLSQMMELILMGDYVSYYLAVLNQVDPTPVKEIDYLKNELNKRRS